MKIRDRENRKILTGFRDMADFFKGNRDLIPPPLVGPLQYVRNGGGVRRGLMKAVTNRYENFWGREWSGLIRFIKEKRYEFFHYLTENSNS